MNLECEIDTRMARVWIRIAGAARHLIGDRLALDLAHWGAWRFVRYRIGGGAWRRFHQGDVVSSSSSTRDVSGGH